jgi:hypothetical protein
MITIIIVRGSNPGSCDSADVKREAEIITALVALTFCEKAINNVVTQK